jgi:hypothetical protein
MVTMTGNVTIETKVCSFLKLKNVNDTVLLNNARKVSDLVLSRTSCLKESSLKMVSDVD